ncbi:hypothetical protein CsatA_020468 [Cannabis sativa]
MATVSNQTVSPQQLQGDDKDNSNIFQLIRLGLFENVAPLPPVEEIRTVLDCICFDRHSLVSNHDHQFNLLFFCIFILCFTSVYFGLWASQPVTVLVSLATVAVALTQEDAMEGGVLKIAYCRKRREVTFNLFVGNLSYDATDKDLKEFFNNEGHSIVSTEVIFRETIQNSLVYGYVSFKSKKEAEAALISVQGKVFMGRPIRIEHSKFFIRNKQPATESVESELTSPELKSGVEEA